MKTRYHLPLSKGTILCFCQSLLIAFFPLLPGHCQIAEWTFENIASAVPGLPITASFSIPQVNAAATLAGGNNNGSPDACSGVETWSTNFWPTTNVRAADEYLEFTVTAHPGETVEVSYFSFSSSASSSNSALQFDVLYSDDNFASATPLFSGSHSIGSCSAQGGGLSASILPGTSLSFRIYPYGQTVAAQAATIRLDNVSLDGAVLPVSLVAFSAVRQEDGILVRWSTATEQTNDFFAVEHSPDGLSFTEAGRVKGAGNSSQLRHYQFTDRHPAAGENYYRLRQVDLDGSAQLHEVVQVHFPGKEGSGIKIWPTAVRETLRVSIATRDRRGSLFIRNLSGLLLLRSETSEQESVREIDVKDWPPGWYLLEYRSLRERTVLRFVKQ